MIRAIADAIAEVHQQRSTKSDSAPEVTDVIAQKVKQLLWVKFHTGLLQQVQDVVTCAINDAISEIIEDQNFECCKSYSDISVKVPVMIGQKVRRRYSATGLESRFFVLWVL